jgi:major capsid protein Gp23
VPAAPVVTNPFDGTQTVVDAQSQADREAMAHALDVLNSPDAALLYQEQLKQKWGGTDRRGQYAANRDWLGEGSEKRGYPKLKTERAKLTMALILENQARFQRSKRRRIVDGEIDLVQDTTTADEALPTRFAFPIIRRVYAQMQDRDWSATQPLPGPTGYIFTIDFLREADTSNLLSLQPNWMDGSELSVPPKGKLSIVRSQVAATKHIMGMAWSLEAMEDARAQLGLDIESELINTFVGEFGRTLMGRHLNRILTATALVGSTPQVTQGTALVTPWTGPHTPVQFPDIGSMSLQDYSRRIYNTLIDADASFQRANRVRSDGIVAGYGMAGYLQKLYTLTGTVAPDDNNMEELGVTNYGGGFYGRWTIWGTEFLPDNVAIMYKRNPDSLRAAHVYAPYIALQVMPAVYADYDASSGNFQNKDAYSRNIRERSADFVTKPYGFMPLLGPAGGFGQV